MPFWKTRGTKPREETLADKILNQILNNSKEITEITMEGRDYSDRQKLDFTFREQRFSLRTNRHVMAASCTYHLYLGNPPEDVLTTRSVHTHGLCEKLWQRIQDRHMEIELGEEFWG